MASVLELPRRLAASVGSSIDAAGELPEFQRELLEHLRSMDAGIQELVGAIVPMRQDIAAVRSSLGPSATGQVERLQQSMTRVEALVSHIDSRIPDPDAPGPIEKAREAITGS